MSNKTMSDPAGRSPSRLGPSRLIEPRGRFWAVHDPDGQLVCLAVYKIGAKEVVRRLFRGEPEAERVPAMDNVRASGMRIREKEENEMKEEKGNWNG